MNVTVFNASGWQDKYKLPVQPTFISLTFSSFSREQCDVSVENGCNLMLVIN